MIRTSLAKQFFQSLRLLITISLTVSFVSLSSKSLHYLQADAKQPRLSLAQAEKVFRLISVAQPVAKTDCFMLSCQSAGSSDKVIELDIAPDHDYILKVVRTRTRSKAKKEVFLPISYIHSNPDNILRKGMTEEEVNRALIAWASGPMLGMCLHGSNHLVVGLRCSGYVINCTRAIEDNRLQSWNSRPIKASTSMDNQQRTRMRNRAIYGDFSTAFSGLGNFTDR